MGKRRRDDDRGITLVEVLIAATLTVFVLTLVTTAMVGSNKLFRAATQENTGQTDVRTTVERLGRDLRDARSIATGATGAKLVVWVDSNSDYIEQSSEDVTWQIVLRSDGIHYDVTRTANGVTSRTAQFVISAIAFSYYNTQGGTALTVPTTGLSATDAAKVRLVSADVVYTPDSTGQTSKQRHAVFTERLRNVA